MVPLPGMLFLSTSTQGFASVEDLLKCLLLHRPPQPSFKAASPPFYHSSSPFILLFLLTGRVTFFVYYLLDSFCLLIIVFLAGLPL
jgi:hypothetical protein